MGAWAAVGTVVLALVGMVVVKTLIKAAVPAHGPTARQSDGRPAESPASAAAPADPATDVTAWKALPPAERKARIEKRLALIDADNRGSVQFELSFLQERGESEAAQTLWARHLEKHPTAEFGYQQLGYVDLGPEIDAAAERFPRSYEVHVPAMAELDKLRDQDMRGGKSWGTPQSAARVAELSTQLVDEERRLSDPYEYGVARWVRWFATTVDYRDCRAIHVVHGPYLLLGALTVPEQGKDPVPPGASAQPDAEAALAEVQRTLDVLYAAFFEQVAKPLGIERATAKNTTHKSLMKVFVLPSQEAYLRMLHAPAAWVGRYGGAYYDFEEPRLLFSYVNSGQRPSLDERSDLCTEAVQQLVQTATWSRTLRDTGKDVPWAECRSRPLWSEYGFPEFFGSLTALDNTYHFGQPDDDHLFAVSTLRPALTARRLTVWSLDELTSIRDRYEFDEAVDRKAKAAGKTFNAKLAYRYLFYAQAWSLAYHLWHAGPEGAPKWRAKYLTYLGQELVARIDADGSAVRPGAAELKKALGLDSAAAINAFESEWHATEDALIARSPRRDWVPRAQALLLALGLLK